MKSQRVSVAAGQPSDPNPTANPAGEPKGISVLDSVSSFFRRALVTVVSAATLTASGVALAAPASAATVGERAVALASQEAGVPYVYGAAGPSSFDCSGLVRYVYAQLGISLPHNTTAQYAAMPHVPKASALLGDIIFVYDASGAIVHDGIYAGNGTMWAAPHTGDVVKRQAIYTSSYYVGRPVGVTSTSGLLQQGSTGPAVTDLQRRLGITADGEYGPATAAAVRGYQQAHGLTVDGVAGPATLSALSGSGVVPVSYVPGGDLRVGSTGPAVIALQRALRIMADGDYGPVTRAAVVAFQGAHGLAADGVVGPRTRTALSSLSA